jgi:hypothetical protein
MSVEMAKEVLVEQKYMKLLRRILGFTKTNWATFYLTR